MIYNYCTLFDSFFLSRGLTLYDSLKRTTPDFRLYIFPFDKKAEKILRALRLPEVVVVSAEEFETPNLLQIKNERTRSEYCWTCTPVIIDHCISTFNLTHCTYLDADLYFFLNANQLIDEMGDKSILITDHRYTSRYDQSKSSGRYCVQFVTFKNDNQGMKALAWWRDRCLEWCFDRFEDGKFGDQKYLDDWTYRFEGVCDLQNEGGGLAPWNIQRYQLVKGQDQLMVKNMENYSEWPVIFYHFHGIKFLSGDKIDLSAYVLNKEMIGAIYTGYVEQLNSYNIKLFKDFAVPYPYQKYTSKKGIPVPIHKIARRILRVYNIFNMKDFLVDSLA